MAASRETSRLESRESNENYLVAYLTRSLLRPENNEVAVVLAMTFVIVATVSIVIQTLKKKCQKGPYRMGRSKRYKKIHNPKTTSFRIDESSINEGSVTSRVMKYESAMIYEKLLGELHHAANKCWVRKYAERCVELVNYCPFLINVKCGTTGLTPFHRVCFHGHCALIKFMLSKGADPHLTFNAGENVICLAVFHCLNKPGHVDPSDLDCLDILQRAGCKLDKNSNWYDKLLKKAVRDGKTALIDWLLTNKKE